MVLVNAQYSNQVLQVDYRPWWIRDFQASSNYLWTWHLLDQSMTLPSQGFLAAQKPEPGGHLHSIFCSSLHSFSRSLGVCHPVWYALSNLVPLLFHSSKIFKAFSHKKAIHTYCNINSDNLEGIIKNAKLS